MFVSRGCTLSTEPAASSPFTLFLGPLSPAHTSLRSTRKTPCAIQSRTSQIWYSSTRDASLCLAIRVLSTNCSSPATATCRLHGHTNSWTCCGFTSQESTAYAQSHSGSSSGRNTPSASGGRSEFMVLRTDRRTGNLQVAGASQTTHSGAVAAMRNTVPESHPGPADGLDVSLLSAELGRL
jgi:hypothetical protein